MSKLYVKEFGPIKSGLSGHGGWLEFPKVTLFCGQQASGKSSVAKLFSIMSWMEKQIYRDPELALDETFFAHAIEWHGIESYLRPDTEIRYRGDLLCFDFAGGKVSASQVFDANHLFVVPKISYMPAERNFASIVRNASRAEGIKVMKYIGDATKELNIESAKSLSKQGIDVFNASNEFFNDICYEYESKDGKDIILNDRRTDIYQNATFCQAGCSYLGMNYNLMVANCKCDSSFLQEDDKNKINNNKSESDINNIKYFTKIKIK